MIWYKNKLSDDIIVSTRIRLARNLADTVFPNSMTEEEKKKAIAKIYDAVKGEKYKLVELDGLDATEKRVMIEKHLISTELAGNKHSAVILDADDEVSIMLMEEDHIRLQVIKGGFDIAGAYDKANEIDDAIEKNVGFAFSEKLGYLTACPTNTGTGMRASVMMHLPALTMTGNIGKIVDSASRLGLTVRGLYGEGSKAYGALYQVSNQVTLGFSEEEIIKKLENIVSQIKAHEEEARGAIKENKNAEDRFWRSYGTLKYARKLSSSEAKSLLSDYILGHSMGIIDEKIKQNPIELMVLTEPGNINKIACEELDADERDERRANLIRSAI